MDGLLAAIKLLDWHFWIEQADLRLMLGQSRLNATTVRFSNAGTK
jgi:hypothetical protein